MKFMFRLMLAHQSNYVYPCFSYRNIITPSTKALYFSTIAPTSTHSIEGVENNIVVRSPNCAAQVLKNFGCTENHIEIIFSRQPSLCNARVAPLEAKLDLLCKLGVKSSDLVKMINCRPRFLSCRINHFFDERLDDMMSFFGSREFLVRAIVRNPSLLICDFHKKLKPVITLYEEIGVRRIDLISMLLHRPTLISRTHMSPEKLEYICKTGISSGSKMYKYVVTIIGVSRLATIREKVANLEKFGFSEDEVLKLFGRCPLMITLSVDKVQRNMTFVIGTLKLPAKTVCDHPFLLYSSLESLLRPRVLLAGKIRDMGLGPTMNGRYIFRALRMSEKRFLKVFVECQQEDYKKELLKYYISCKNIKPLAESSKKVSYTSGFPF